MKEQSTRDGSVKADVGGLEAFARQGVQRLLQQLLEEEVEDVLGRSAMRGGRGGRGAGLSQRVRQAAPAECDERDDHAPPAARPRAGGAVRKPAAAAVQAAHRGSRPAPAGVVPARAGPRRLRPGPAGAAGAGAPLSAASVARLKGGWQAEYETWKRRRVDDLEPVYLWADGIYVKAGLEKDKAAMLVVIAGLRDGRKVVLAVESGYRESTESWAALRGPQGPRACGRRGW